MHFDPPNRKILVIDSLRVEKVGILRILITGSPTPIPIVFLPTILIDVWEVRVKFHGYWIDDLCFDPPNPQKLSFSKREM